MPTKTILAAAIRQGIGLPYGCKDGACGSCKCKKLEGDVSRWRLHQSKALSAEEEAAGYVLTCCAMPQTDVVLESRQVTDDSAFPIRKMPSRVQSHREEVARRGDAAPAAAGRRTAAASTPGSTSNSSCATARGAATRWPMRRTRWREPGTGIELHIRHMPGGKFTDHVFSAMKEKEILRVEGPVRQLLPARGFRQADGAAGFRHGLRADQGAARAHAVQGHRPARDAVLGRPPAGGPVHGRLGARGSWPRCRTCATCR